MVTADCHAFTAVEVTPTKSAAYIWERIFTEVYIHPFIAAFRLLTLAPLAQNFG
jgi:hypothetical protein